MSKSDKTDKTDTTTKIRMGLDLGTKTVVCASRDADKRIKYRQEINGFLTLQNKDAFTRNMLTKQKIPFIERDGKFIALGNRAEKFAYATNGTLRRPMAEGTVSHEEEAITIMASIVQALLGTLSSDTILYYCIPANAINKATNVSFHDKIAHLIFDNYKRSDITISAFAINEARAIAIASGEPIAIAISWGAGMVNTCYTMYGVPIFEFSIVGAGDWIDTEAAKQFGYDPASPRAKSQETPTSICHHKENIDLSNPLQKAGRLDQAVMLHYQLLIENVIGGIIQGFEDNVDRVNIDEPVPIIMAGGTAKPNGFKEYFEKILSQQALPFEVSGVKLMEKPLYAVAEGCLIAAEMHEDS